MNQSEEELAAQYTDRHKREQRFKSTMDGQGADGYAAQQGNVVMQQSLLPTITDPRLFKIK
jgi:hypothetical protein